MTRQRQLVPLQCTHHIGKQFLQRQGDTWSVTIDGQQLLAHPPAIQYERFRGLLYRRCGSRSLYNRFARFLLAAGTTDSNLDPVDDGSDLCGGPGRRGRCGMLGLPGLHCRCHLRLLQRLRAFRHRQLCQTRLGRERQQPARHIARHAKCIQVFRSTQFVHQKLSLSI